MNSERMEGLVPTKVKLLYTALVLVHDEINATVADAEISLSTGRGQSVLTTKTCTLERLNGWYDRMWGDLSSYLLINAVSLTGLYKAYTLPTKEAILCQDKLAVRLDQLSSSPDAHPRLPLKLPEIKLFEFSGELDRWTQFCDFFMSLVDECSDLSVSMKVTYFNNMLKGPSAEVIVGFAVTYSNYKETKGLLLRHYQDDNRCTRNLICKLNDLKTPCHDHKEFLKFRIQCNQLHSSLSTFKDVEAAA